MRKYFFAVLILVADSAFAGNSRIRLAEECISEDSYKGTPIRIYHTVDIGESCDFGPHELRCETDVSDLELNENERQEAVMLNTQIITKNQRKITRIIGPVNVNNSNELSFTVALPVGAARSLVCKNAHEPQLINHIGNSRIRYED